MNALLCECIQSQLRMHAILCINRTKKSIHGRIYKLARIWSIKNIPVLATEERSTTINYMINRECCVHIKLEPIQWMHSYKEPH